eukprot:scaffold667826_cov74-Prasinocladus_malaysianus.AAC.1
MGLSDLDDLVEPPAALHGGDLPGVALADGQESVAGDDPALEEVDGLALGLRVVLVRPGRELPLHRRKAEWQGCSVKNKAVC